MTGCDATLQLMLNWLLSNRLIEGFHVRDTDVAILLPDGPTLLAFDDARAFMQSVICGYARSCDSTIKWPAHGEHEAFTRLARTF